MINIIKSDFYRIFRGVAIYIGILMILVMAGIGIYNIEPGYIGMVSSKNFEDTNYDEVLSEVTTDEMRSMTLADYRHLMMKVEGYKLDKAILGTNMNLYYVFIFVAALAVTVDFSGSSIKNTLSSAISRKKYYISKIIFVNLLCIMILAANTYFVYFANLIFNGERFASDLGTVTKITVMQIPPVMALAAILTGIAFITLRTAFYNTVTIPFIMVFQIVLSLAGAAFSIKDEYLDYEIQIMLGNLAYSPTSSYVIHSYILCGGLMVFFYLIGWLSFRKAEIR